MVHETYLLRGVEVTLNGTVNAPEGVLVLAGEGHRATVTLTSLQPGQKVQWDRAAASPEPLRDSEAAAYSTLLRSAPGSRRPPSHGHRPAEPDRSRVPITGTPRRVNDTCPFGTVVLTTDIRGSIYRRHESKP